VLVLERNVVVNRHNPCGFVHLIMHVPKLKCPRDCSARAVVFILNVILAHLQLVMRVEFHVMNAVALLQKLLIRISKTPPDKFGKTSRKEASVVGVRLRNDRVRHFMENHERRPCLAGQFHNSAGPPASATGIFHAATIVNGPIERVIAALPPRRRANILDKIRDLFQGCVRLLPRKPRQVCAIRKRPFRVIEVLTPAVSLVAPFCFGVAVEIAANVSVTRVGGWRVPLKLTIYREVEAGRHKKRE